MKVANLYLLGRRAGLVDRTFPHIWFEKGYWKVSPAPKSYHLNSEFVKAHIFVGMLNFKLYKR